MPRKRTLANEQQHEETVAREPGDEQREPLPPQRGWKHDNAAGVERLYYTDTEQGVYEAWLKFRDGKPSEAVRNFMKDNGYRWQPEAPSGGRWPEVQGAWVRPTNYQTLSQDRLHHERVFAKVVEMIYAEKGIEAGQSQGQRIPF
ncbi:MAG TPA: hypothetical protein VG826_15085 [Pirellulales bacterium]|nr:hypothetical protein [Pirellulales bacterium]